MSDLFTCHRFSFLVLGCVATIEPCDLQSSTKNRKSENISEMLDFIYFGLERSFVGSTKIYKYNFLICGSVCFRSSYNNSLVYAYVKIASYLLNPISV